MANPSTRPAALEHLKITSELAGMVSPDGRLNGDANDLLRTIEQFTTSYGRVLPLVVKLAHEGLLEEQHDDGSGRLRAWVDERPRGAGSEGE